MARTDVEYWKPYELRNTFATVLAHGGRSIVYMAKQLGHGAALWLETYEHVIDELDDSPRISADEAIRIGGEQRANSATG